MSRTRLLDLARRSWDELEAAGADLAKNGVTGKREIITVIARVERRFEAPRTREEQAVGGFLRGLLDALNDADADRPKGAQ